MKAEATWHEPDASARRTVREPHNGGSDFRRGITLGALIKLTLSPEVQLLGSLFTARSIGLLFGARGSGKSWLAMLITYAVAGGKTLDPWGAGQGVCACYLDGEMRIRGFRDRLEQLHAFDSDDETRERARRNLHIVSRDLVGDTIGSIDTEEGQSAIDARLPDDVRLIVIDNLSAWTEGGAENLQAWQGVKRWLIQKRLDGIAVLIVHHAGKSGAQRGTSAHEDLLDYAIQVTPALDLASAPNETCFTVEHTKLRDHLPGLRGKSLFTLWPDAHSMRFRVEGLKSEPDKLLAEILKIKEKHPQWTLEQVGVEVGRSKSQVSRILAAYKQQPSVPP